MDFVDILWMDLPLAHGARTDPLRCDGGPDVMTSYPLLMSLIYACCSRKSIRQIDLMIGEK